MKSDPRQMISQNSPEYQIKFFIPVDKNNFIFKFEHYLIKQDKSEKLINKTIILPEEWENVGRIY